MKKKLLFFYCIIASPLLAIPINKPDLSSYKTQKKIGGILGDFNNLNENFKFNNITGIENTLNFGPLYYKYIKNNDIHIIGFSKNLTDFLISKYYVNMNEFYKNKELILSEYEYILNTYSEYIIKNKELELQNEYYTKIVNDKNIIDIKFKNGKISEIDYEILILEIENSKNNLNIIEQEIEKLKNELEQYDIDTKNIEEFIIPKFNSNDIENYIKEQNEKSRIENSLSNQRKIYNLMPSIEIGANYNLKNNEYSFSLNINKNFKINMEDITETNLGFNKKEKFIEFDDEIEKYKNLKNVYDFNSKKQKLMEKAYNISKLKYELGKISYKDLLDEKIKLNTSILEVIKSKNNLAIYLLKRGI